MSERRAAVDAPAVARVLPGVDEPAAQRGRELVEAAEVRVVARPLAGQHGVERVVEVVAPLGVEAVAAELASGGRRAGR